ncbi:hypothetical protein VR41_10960 [Streptomyces sp. NRRL B-1568]|nr:hypothetical protein VR41_10960 [Streptomyces sp. NRRL B-1568]
MVPASAAAAPPVAARKARPLLRRATLALPTERMVRLPARAALPRAPTRGRAPVGAQADDGAGVPVALDDRVRGMRGQSADRRRDGDGSVVSTKSAREG